MSSRVDHREQRFNRMMRKKPVLKEGLPKCTPKVRQMRPSIRQENSAKAHAYAAEKPFFLCTRNIGFDDFSAVMN